MTIELWERILYWCTGIWFVILFILGIYGERVERKNDVDGFLHDLERKRNERRFREWTGE